MLVQEEVVEVKGSEPVALPLIELVLELDPVQSECVQEALHDVHEHQNEQSHTYPQRVTHD